MSELTNTEQHLDPREYFVFNESVQIPGLPDVPYREIPHNTVGIIRVFPSVPEAALVYAYDIYNLASHFPNRRFNLPTGNTQMPMYDTLPYLVKHFKHNPFDTLRGSPLDEYYPIHPKHPNSFTEYHDSRIARLGVKFDHINGLAPNLELELTRLNSIIEKDPGVVSAFGTDDTEGHICFIPPGTPFSTQGYIYASLSQSTITRDTIDRQQNSPDGSITGTFNTTSQADAVLVAGWGSKGKTFKMAFQDNPPTPDIPLSIMQLPDIGPKVSAYMDANAGLRYVYPDDASILCPNS